jgi:hypothetical protein
MPKHDVFISYSHEDQPYLDSLVTAFEAGGIDAITDGTFTVGRNIERMIREAIDRSRHVALILTPQWLASRWTSYEAALALIRDREGDLGIVLPLIYEKIELPELLRPILNADLCEESRRATGLQRVIKTIQDSRLSEIALPLEPAERPVSAKPAVAALERLAEAADTEAVRTHLLEFREQISRASEQIRRLADLKDVHEQLHHLQLQFYPVTGSRMGTPQDPLPIAKLYAIGLESALGELDQIAARSSLHDGELAWVEDLRYSHLQLVKAIEANKKERAQDLIDYIEHLLAENSTQINSSLRMVLSILRLPDLVEVVDRVCDHTGRLLVHANDRKSFVEGLTTLRHLARNVSALIADHDRWQRTDTSLRLVDRTLHAKITNLLITWPRIIEDITVLDRAQHSESLRDLRNDLEEAIQHGNHQAAWEPYQLFRRYTVDRFYKVDRSLKRQCDELRIVGVPLAVLSGKLA